jgi:hypothetical protein
MNKNQIGKIIMWAVGTALTLASSFVAAKSQDAQIKEAVAKEVAEALKK